MSLRREVSLIAQDFQSKGFFCSLVIKSEEHSKNDKNFQQKAWYHFFGKEEGTDGASRHT